jgi:hypothetical protein
VPIIRNLSIIGYFMKNLSGISGVILLIIIIYSCQKKEVPVLITSAITDITGTTASGGGTITNEGSDAIIVRGVCWSTGIKPILADCKTTDGSGAGTYTSVITGLNGATTYFVRAYATNSTGTGYGMEISFTTFGQSPTPTVAEATNINVMSASLNGNVNANYLTTVVTFEYGTTTSYESIATAIQSPVTGNMITNVSADITGLTPATIYHYRIKAVNSLGTSYGSDITFITLGQAPEAVTGLPSDRTIYESVLLNGLVNANYLPTIVTFEYGTTTSYGDTETAFQSPVTGNNYIEVSTRISPILGTTVHYRVKAVNSLGTAYGGDIEFQFY